MKPAIIPPGLIATALLLIAAGCGTVEFARTPDHDPAGQTSGREPSRKASALAAYSLGVRAQDQGDMEAAVTHFREAVRLDPDNPDLAMDLAVGLLHQGRFEEMDDVADDLIVRYPSLVKPYQLKALGYRIRGMNAEAVPLIRQAIRLEPGEPLHYIETASIHLRAGNADLAHQILADGLAAATNRQPLFHALAELYLREAGQQVSAGTPPLDTAPLELLARGVEAYPDDITLLNQYGDLLILHKRLEEAIDVFARIEELKPDDLRLRQKLALSLVAAGDRARAIELLEDIAARRADNPRIWHYLAELHEQAEDTDRAIECYDEVIRITPQSADAYLRKAYLQLNAADAKAARATLEAGSRAVQDDFRMGEMLAYVHMLNGDFADALAEFERVDASLMAREKSPLMSNFYENYAIASQMQGRYREAADILVRAAARFPDVFEDYLGQTLRNRRVPGRLEGALEVLGHAESAMPQTSSLFTLYALTAFNAESFEKALALFEKTEQLAVDAGDDEELDAQFYFWMGASAERSKNYDRAEELFLMAISRQPDHAESHNYLAYMHAERGVKLEMALDHVGVALAVEPENAAYLDTRGWIYYHQGRYEDALADIEAAAERLPDDPTIADHMGDVLKALGREDEAVTWWQRSLEADPENETVRGKLQDAGFSNEAPEAEPLSPAAPTSPAG